MALPSLPNAAIAEVAHRLTPGELARLGSTCTTLRDSVRDAAWRSWAQRRLGIRGEPTTGGEGGVRVVLEKCGIALDVEHALLRDVGAHETCTTIACRGAFAPRDDRLDKAAEDVDWQAVCRLLAPLHAVCPMCASCSTYVGSEFTQPGIDTGWRAQLVLEGTGDGAHARPLTYKLARRAAGPRLAALRLRPLVHDSDVTDVDASNLFRSADGLADRLVSTALSASHRYALGDQTLGELGVDVYDCLQLGKNARVAFTRVGRYCDEHGDRAHVFGTLPDTCRGCVGVGPTQPSPNALTAWIGRATCARPEEPPCPLCDGMPFALDASALRVVGPLAPELEHADGSLAGVFDGALFACAAGAHIWGWRRQAGGGTLLHGLSPACSAER